MIRLGLRLSLNGGKEAAVRLALTSAAVGLGVCLLLVALSGMNAINAQNARGAWLATTAGPPGPQQTGAGDPLWGSIRIDHFGSQTIYRVDVAAGGPHAPVPPGIPQLPGPGQYYASPSMTRLLHRLPATELAERYPGSQIGQIGPSALPAPDSLIIVVGMTVQQVAHIPGSAPVYTINTNPRVNGPDTLNSTRLNVILAVGALALLFPVLVLIGTAARLAAARREQRFAAMRLVGATPRQIVVISTVEASAAGLIGVALGFLVFFLLRPWLTTIDFTGQRFAPGDLSLSPANVLVVALGVPIAAAISARVAMRRVDTSPLSVTRRTTPGAPRAWRLVPLAAGIVELFYFVVVGRPGSTGGQIWAYMSGCFLMLVGLVMAGPWLTMVGSKLMAYRANRPAGLLAGRRLADNPRAAFRTISGLIIALFATSVSVGIIGTMLADRGGTSGGGSDASNTLLIQFRPMSGSPIGAPDDAATPLPAVPASLLARLRSIPHIEGVTPVYSGAGGQPVVTCSDLRGTPAIGRCPAGAAAANLHGDLLSSKLPRQVREPADVTADQVRALPIIAIFVESRGSLTARETARTMLEAAFPNRPLEPATLGELNLAGRRTIVELQQMTNVVIVVSLVIAGCSLAVSVTGGINDRKRPFSLLRLSGVPLQVLRKLVLLEAAVPLLFISVISVAMGFLAAGLFLSSQLGETLRPPGGGFYGLVGAGLVASLAIIMCTFPLIERITGPETARNE